MDLSIVMEIAKIVATAVIGILGVFVGKKMNNGGKK